MAEAVIQRGFKEISRKVLAAKCFLNNIADLLSSVLDLEYRNLISRRASRTQSNIKDGALYENSQRLLAVNYFRRKLHLS